MECCAIPLHLRGQCGILQIGVRRRIEVVITGLTRNVTDLVTRERAKARVFVDSLANASFFLNFG